MTSSDADLIAYLEQRRAARWRAVRYSLLAVVALLLAVFVVTAILHVAGVGSHTHTTVNIGPSNFHVIRTQVGAVPILP